MVLTGDTVGPVAVHRHLVPAEWRWVPPGLGTRIAGYDIPGGMIYVGRHLRSMTGGIEPALINPDLPVAEDSSSPPTGRRPGLPTAYHLISPATRAAYLQWLADGRQTEAPAGLVLLFCFGLERRVVMDTGDDPAVGPDLSAITTEVRRLRVRYRDTGPVFRDFPRPPEICARRRGQDQIASPRGLEELQQLPRCVGHVGLPRA